MMVTTKSALKSSSLGNLLIRGLDLYDLVKENSEGLDTGSKKYQESVQEAVSSFLSVESAIEKTGVFSSNEGANDFGTNDLLFFLVDARLGDLFLLLRRQERGKDMGEIRLETIAVVEKYFESFFQRLHNYKLLRTEDLTYLEACVRGKTLFSTQVEPEQIRRGVTRDERIARYKQEKELRTQLDTLKQKLGAAAHDESGKLADEFERDELVRDLALKQIQLCVQDTLESYRTLLDEKRLLETFQKRKFEQERKPDAENKSDSAWTLDQSSSKDRLLDKTGKVLRPFVITSSRRQEVLSGVFKPHWNLPTMTVDEYLELEQERGNIIEGGGFVPEEKKTSTEESVEDDHNLQAQNEETYRLREWDAFKDDNPKGWGNRGGNRG